MGPHSLTTGNFWSGKNASTGFAFFRSFLRLSVPLEAQHLDNCIKNMLVNSLRSSPRPISIAQLHTLLHFHLRPINHVVFMGSYSLRMGDLILKSASRLDAFSVYPIRTWLPSYAVGTTTDTPLVRPSRSSRTEDSSSQISCAHDG